MATRRQRQIVEQACGLSLTTLAAEVGTTPGRLLLTLESEGFRKEGERIGEQVRAARARATLSAQFAAADYLWRLLTLPPDELTKEKLALGDLCLNILKNSDLLKEADPILNQVQDDGLQGLLGAIERTLDERQAPEELNVDGEVMRDEP